MVGRGFMKRFFILGALLGLFFASCSYNASDYSQSGSRSKQKNDDEELQLFSFVLDNDFVSTVQKSSGISKLNSVTVRIEFTGGYEATDTKNLSFSELPGTSFNFTDIPLNKAFTVKILVYHGSVLKYEAIKENIILEKGGENDLSMVLKSVFDFADETKYILWSGNQLYTSQNPKSALTEHPVRPVEVTRYFFDAPGNVWVFSMMDGYKLVCEDGKSIEFSMEEKDGKIKHYRNFACAREFNLLYAFGAESTMDQSDSPKYIVTQFPNALTDLNLSASLTYEFKLPENTSFPDLFTVYNDGDENKVYAYCSSGSTETTVHQIFEFDLNKAEDNVVAGREKVNLSENLPEGIINPVISDMLYQDGAVYVIVNCSSTDFTPAASLYNYGFILKYDTLTNLVSTTGLSKKEIKNTDVPYMYCFSEDGKIAYNESSWSTLFKVDGSKVAKSGSIEGTDEKRNFNNTVFPNIITAETKYENSNLKLSSNFYCPKKFIAIKPKKLVIADDGYAFYVDDNNALSFKNVNRIVTVDLESFALETSSESVPVAFDDDTSVLQMSKKLDDNELTDGSCYTGLTQANIYIEGSTNYKNAMTCYLGIKNGESN